MQVPGGQTAAEGARREPAPPPDVPLATPSTFALLKQSVRDFLDDDSPRQAAALSYYTVFSLPPLLILLLTILGAVMDAQDVQGLIQGQVGAVVSPGVAGEVQSMIENANRPGSGGVAATLFGVAALLFGATGAFAALQAALNRAWEVEPDPNEGGLKNFIFKRVLSFGMILGVAFLLLVSLVLSAALSAFGGALGAVVPGGLSEWVLQLLNIVISLAVITLLFAAMFKILPDAVVAWRDVWIGAGFTALLFVLGKFALGSYLGRSNPGEAYGAAGSLALLLLWVYYSAMILLLGAEFTQAWAQHRGSGIEPEQGAVRLRGDPA